MNDSATTADQIAILQEQEGLRARKADRERYAVLRVYNWFRIFVSILLMFIFYRVPEQTVVGTLEPRWFEVMGLAYLMFNIGCGLATMFDTRSQLANENAIASIVVLDIFFISLLLLTSGGVDSGIGILLVFTVAFGSVMIGRQQSVGFPAIAAVNSLSVELYMERTGAVLGSQHYFEVALLGIAMFIVNLFFQYVARLLAEREEEVIGLETLDRMHRIAEASRRELEIANARFNALLRSTGEGVLVLDHSGRIKFANGLAGSLLDAPHEALIGQDIRSFLIERPTDEEETARMRRFHRMIGAEPGSYSQGQWKTEAGEPFLVDFSFDASDESGLENDIVLLFRNVTIERENEDRLRYLANHDELTGLANRTAFKDMLSRTVVRVNRVERGLAILLIDTDHFTVVNEERGQAFGDELLKEIANRLTRTVREGDLVARLHGDQFAVMLVDLERDEDAGIVADKINTGITQPMNIAGQSVDTSVSIGISVMSDSHEDADELLSAATAAMERAKTEGRNTYRFYRADMQRAADDKRRVQMMLRSAVDNGEFRMMYQPIVSLKEGRIYSSEALIRWFPAEGEPIRPDIFIPIAEDSGQINAIGSWVLSEVSQQVRQWKDLLGYYPSIAINVSSKQLRDAAFREQFQDILVTTSLPVSIVEMELTETGVMEDPETTLAELNQLRDLGVKISIDDFGTGYSSLDYLRRLPLDILKIDQSFTRGIGESENDEEIVRVMIRMAHAMGLRVICEGVETAEHLAFLREHDCDFCQGYYFSKPRTAESLTELLIGERDNTIDIMSGAAG